MGTADGLAAELADVDGARTTTDEPSVFQLVDVADATTDETVLRFVEPNEADATTDEPAVGGGEDMPSEATDCDWQHRT
jgi:hypothetical protein